MNTHKDNPLENLEGTDFSKYRIGAKIGQGGYATVFRATDPELGRDVALKVLLPRPGGGYPEVLRSRFVREAKLVARLRDVRSIKVLEYGEFNELLFIAFEFIDGQSLDVWMERKEPMPPLRVIKILEQSLESLADAHDLGIVHRDIKPGNIMLYEIAGRRDQVKVLDFGIGKYTDVNKVSINLTREGSWMGTPRYMAPEQVRGDSLSGQSDLYSLGLVAYELLSGLPAIKATEPMEAIAEIASNEDLLLPSELKIPKGLADIVNKMIRKDPSRRYKTAVEVLRDLQVLSRTSDISGLHLSPNKVAVASSLTLKEKPKTPAPVVFIIILIAVVALTAVWLVGPGDTEELDRASALEALASEVAAPAAPVEVAAPAASVEVAAPAASVEVAAPAAPVEVAAPAAPVASNKVAKKSAAKASIVGSVAPAHEPAAKNEPIKSDAPAEVNPVVQESQTVESVDEIKTVNYWGVD